MKLRAGGGTLILQASGSASGRHRRGLAVRRGSGKGLEAARDAQATPGLSGGMSGPTLPQLGRWAPSSHLQAAEAYSTLRGTPDCPATLCPPSLSLGTPPGWPVLCWWPCAHCPELVLDKRSGRDGMGPAGAEGSQVPLPILRARPVLGPHKGRRGHRDRPSGGVMHMASLPLLPGLLAWPGVGLSVHPMPVPAFPPKPVRLQPCLFCSGGPLVWLDGWLFRLPHTCSPARPDSSAVE